MNIADAARRFRDAFHYDPGHSDLDDEQPISISVTLGDWRKLDHALSSVSETRDKLYTKADAEALCEIAKVAAMKLQRGVDIEECARVVESAEVTAFASLNHSGDAVEQIIRDILILAGKRIRALRAT